jgi:hypothetical protein
MMLTITLKVNAPAGQAIGIKEHLAMVLEDFGDVRVVNIEDDIEKSGELNTLLRHKRLLTKQQFRTLWGQAKAGDPDAAMKGLKKTMRRLQGGKDNKGGGFV